MLGLNGFFCFHFSLPLNCFSSFTSISFLHPFFSQVVKTSILSSLPYLVPSVFLAVLNITPQCFCKEDSLMHLFMTEFFCSLLTYFSSSLQNSEGNKCSLTIIVYSGGSIFISLLSTLQPMYHRITSVRHSYLVTDLSHRPLSFSIVPRWWISAS